MKHLRKNTIFLVQSNVTIIFLISYFNIRRNIKDKPIQPSKLIPIAITHPKILCSSGKGIFIPKKPVTIVGIVNKIDSTVKIFIVSFKLLFKILLYVPDNCCRTCDVNCTISTSCLASIRVSSHCSFSTSFYKKV